MYMLSNDQWKAAIGFVPSTEIKENATSWGVSISYYFRDTLSRAGLQKLCLVKPDEDFPPLARAGWEIFNRLGEQAPRLIKMWAEQEEEEDEVEQYLRDYRHRTEKPNNYLVPPLPQRRWRTVKEYAKYLHLEGEQLKNQPFYKDPPPIEGVKYINSPAALASAADQFRNCAASYKNAIRSGSERIVILEDRIMVRYDPIKNLLLEAKYKYNEGISSVDKSLVKAVLGLH